MITIAEQEKFEEMVERAKEMMAEVGLELPHNITYKVNARLKSTLGRCRIIRGSNAYIIEIAEFLLKGNLQDNNDMATISTILHEMCHTLPNSVGHGDVWKADVGKLNRKFGLDISRTSKVSQSCEKFQYAGRETVRVACENGCFEYVTLKSSKISKDPSNFRCKVCYSEPVIISENSNKGIAS